MGNGVVLWEGPSEYTAEPVVVVATGIHEPSENTKTGPMVQVSILPARVDPLWACKTGQDAAVCGSCPRRPYLRRVMGSRIRHCYVPMRRFPLGTWRTWRRGRYPRDASFDALRGRSVRIGAYGDPAAMPYHVTNDITRVAGSWTGYTHGWRVRPDLAGLLEASVESPEEAREAQALGFCTFRVSPGLDVLPGETRCAASAECGHRIQCIGCNACNGNHNKVIREH